MTDDLLDRGPAVTDRTCPASIRPATSSIRAGADRKRRAAWAIDAWSFPILNAATDLTFRWMPWLVMQSSTISVARIADCP
jgi:hypothetical protein